MDAKELMIGDWVYSTFCDNPCKVVGVEQYESGYANVKVTNVSGAKDINSLIPIPLTAEILKKNGFEYYHKNFASLRYDHPFKLEMEKWPDENGLGGLWSITDLIKIRYVHELQQAMRMCSIEKEIIL